MNTNGRMRVSTGALIMMLVIGVLVMIVGGLLEIVVQPPESPFAPSQTVASIETLSAW